MLFMLDHMFTKYILRQVQGILYLRRTSIPMVYV